MASSGNNATAKQTPVAIIGMGCLFPRAHGLKAYWRLLRTAGDSVTEVPETHWSLDDYFDPEPGSADLTYCRRGAFLEPTDFDPAEFGIPPTALEATDTAQLLGLVVAKAALEDAGYGADRAFDRTRTSVLLGVTGTQELVIPLGARLGHPFWRRAMRDAGVSDRVAENVIRKIGEAYVPWQENSFPGLLGNVVAGRIANRLNLKGTNCVVDAACASSLSATHLALLELSSGRTDMVVTGGVDALNDIFMFMCFSKTQALSPTGNAKPFSKDADGTVIGEGVGMLVLKRLDDAERDGDRIYAVIRGIGTSSDGRSQSIYAPRASGQAEALRDAYAVGGVDPSTVELVEAHGTGTKVGDAVEFDSLKSVYRTARGDGRWCALGSVKSQIGHTKAAAGAAGLIKAALALHHKVLPATIKVTEPNPNLDLDASPFYLNTETRPWIGAADRPRRSGVSAFGFGGSNFHAVLEEYAGAPAQPAWDGSTPIIALSAASVAELQDKIEQWSAFLNKGAKPDAIAFRALESRRAFSAADNDRLVLVIEPDADVAKLVADAGKALATKGTEPSWSLPNAFFGGPDRPGRLAFVFPGQGSQYVNMGRNLVCVFPEAREAVAEAHRDGAADGETRLGDRIFPHPVFDDEAKAAQQTALRQTEVAQPALGAVSLAMLRVLGRFGIRPDFVAGHSYGELVALRAAGRIDDRALWRLSSLRGRLMAEGSGDRGTMVAVQAPLTELDRMLADERIDVVLANRNSPAQGVLSGTRDAIDRAVRACTSRGWRTTPLDVSAAFHSRLMTTAAERFRRGLDDIAFSDGTVPVYANCTGRAYPDDSDAVRDLLARQLINPVNFVTEIENLHAAGARTFVEVGPRKILSGLIRATLGNRPHDVVPLDAGSGRGSGIADLARALARLSALGHAVDLSAWEPDCPEPRRPKMVVPLLGTNYRSPRKPAAEPQSTKDESSRDGISNVSSNVPPSNESMSGAPEHAQRVPQSDPQPAPTPPVPTPTAPVTSAPRPERVAPDQLNHVLQTVQEGLRAMQALQQQTAEAHQRFLEGQETAHKTFQMVMESQQRLVEHSLGVQVSPPVTHPAITPPAPPPAIAAPPPVPAPPAPAQPVAAPEPPASQPTAASTPVEIPVAPPVAPEPASVGMPPQPGGGHEQAETVLLEVVAELTGYPIEMLDLDMDLEADLGIDSIKRLEILAGVQSKLPETESIDSAYVGSLRTLRNIIDYMKTTDGAPDAPPPASPAKVAPCCEQAGAPEEPRVAREDAATPSAALDRRVLRAVALPALSGDGRVDVAPGRDIWIVDDGTKLPEAICNAFTARGQAARVVPADFDTDGNGIARIGGLVVLAEPNASSGSAWSTASEKRLKRAFALTRRVGSMLREAAAAGGAVFATVARMDGAFGLTGAAFDPVQGGLAGLTKTVAREWSPLRCKALDVATSWDDVEAIAAALVRELGTDGPIEVGLDATHRRGLETVSTVVTTGRQPLNAGDVVVVTGGARGVTAEVACALASDSKPTLVLLGRSPEPQPEPPWLRGVTDEAEVKRALLDHAFDGQGKPTPAELEARYRQAVANREVRDTLERIEQAGGRAIYRSVDVCDRAAVAAALTQIRESVGPIRGLIHAAGVLEDRWIDDKTIAQFERVFDTKVAGLRHLLEASDPDDLKCVVLFSSVSGRFGRQGQVDYAMANEVLNKVAQRQAVLRPSCRVVSINWGPWDGGMVTPALKRDFIRAGIGLIPLEAGARSLIDELAGSDASAIEVVIGESLPDAPVGGGDASSAAPALTKPELTPTFERTLDLERHAFLNSHVIGGYPVLPVAVMLEWLGHAALHDNPGLLLHGIDKFRVLKGVILNNGPCDLRAAASKARRDGDFFVVDVELRSGAGGGNETTHARTRVILTATLPQPPAYAPPPHLDAQDYVRSADAAYHEVLFHGPHFHGIERVEGHSCDGIVARVRPAPAPADWMTDPPRSAWLGDPLVVDAGLQMGILWCHEQMDALSLPSYGARYRQYAPAFPADGVTAALEVRERTTHRMTADITFLDTAGTVVARMEGYEWTVDASLHGAFGREALSGTRP